MFTLGAVAIICIGSWLAWNRAPFSFGLGDNTFFDMAGRWLGSGGVYIRDFIHFRTPGAYYFYAAVQAIFGTSFHSTAFALQLETLVIQPVASFALAAAATRVLLGRTSFVIAGLVGLSFFFLVPIFQLRTAMPALALAPYLLSTLPDDALDLRLRRLALISTGALLGLSYWAGQETLLFVLFAILVSEVVYAHGSARRLAVRAFIALGAAGLVVVLPLAWLCLRGMDIRTYLFYTNWYAFVIQPSGLNLPFPEFTAANLYYYLPFFVLSISAAVFAGTGALAKPGAVALLGYASLRMISALGRADFLHIAFSVSEIPVILPIAIVLLMRSRIGPETFAATITLVISTGLFALGMRNKSAVLFVIPPLLAIIGARSDAIASVLKRGRFSSLAAGAVSTIVMFYMQYPGNMYDVTKTIDTTFSAAPRKVDFPYSGVALSQDAQQELTVAGEFIKQRGVRSIFAYPTIPEYYTFAPTHPSRVVYFENEIQPFEITQTISELSATPPDLVVQSFDQVVGQSPLLYRIADYVSSHYDTTKYLQDGRSIEFLLPSPTPHARRRFVDRIYLSNSDRQARVSADLEPENKGALAPVITALKPARFDFEAGPETVLSVALLGDKEGFASKASVQIVEGGQSRIVDVVGDGSPVTIPLDTHGLPFTISLLPGADGRPSRWLNPLIEDQSTPRS